ncbi:hypothetical protein [Capnocytophaga cynodegmi]|uniref:KilA-N domain-containing protein n=1 Tax=Capnocytophaga cynodegmi TaxID=28189 RepID=A0A0B7H7H6_9FLAO|nr:hypothetical protein [Capnocytophaga cynodegmi]CEN33583.1 hypothetical protein CCYN74_10060 [Capnocytophaga cynodegmi]CEN41930.1 hypothetical protein CCYN49044_60069 [Capnocytophaga cynodegmi]
MKTNVIMKSADRNLFGVIIKQNTKNGQSLSVTDLMKAYQTARFEYGWSNRQVEDIVKTKPFQERVYHLLNERGIIKMNIISFMQFVEKEGVIKTLKGLKVWKTTGRGENKSTYADPYIWVLLAMELNPLIYAKVVIWLTDSLIFNRILAGSEFAPMNRAIATIIEEPNYALYSREINNKVFGRHEKGIRDTATRGQLQRISDIEKFVTQVIEQKLITSESQLLKVIENYNKA